MAENKEKTLKEVLGIIGETLKDIAWEVGAWFEDKDWLKVILIVLGIGVAGFFGVRGATKAYHKDYMKDAQVLHGTVLDREIQTSRTSSTTYMKVGDVWVPSTSTSTSHTFLARFSLEGADGELSGIFRFPNAREFYKIRAGTVVPFLYNERKGDAISLVRNGWVVRRILSDQIDTGR
jgi:hypothetical protein